MSDILDATSSLLDEVSETFTGLKDPLAPVHEELKNMTGDEFMLMVLVVLLFIGLLVAWALLRSPKVEVCQHQCAVHTSA
jgi:hypothetical protein